MTRRYRASGAKETVINIGGIGSFAGGLAGGYMAGEQSRAKVAQMGAETEGQEQKNEADRNHRAAVKEYGVKVDEWKAGGMQGPAPTLSDFEPGAAATGAAGPAARNATANTPAANPGRAQLAMQLKGLGFHSLAAGVSGGDTAQPDEPVPMLTQPSGSTGQPNAMSAQPPLPNLQQIAAQAAAQKRPAYDPSNTFGA